MKKTNYREYMNPYIAGILLGLVLIVSYVIIGAGLGASAGIARIGAFWESFFAPAHVQSSSYFGNWGNKPLYYYLVFMFYGVFFGGLVSSLWNERFVWKIEKGKKKFC